MFTLNCKGSLWMIDEPQVMGIINTTPDSFYDKSRMSKTHAAIELAAKMLEEGATIVDIGGQSTRPGASFISASEEMDRVLPVIEAIHQQFPQLLISIDSFNPQVVKQAVHAGASIVNDISGGQFFEDMLATVAALKVPYICMHCSSDINTMHDKKASPNITQIVIDYFIERVAACKKAGILDVLIDPGFGFGKTIENNYQLLNELACFSIFETPILLGISRKSMIYQPLQIDAANALNGTTVLHTVGLLKGANIIRVHDVKEAAQAIKLTQLLGPKRN